MISDSGLRVFLVRCTLLQYQITPKGRCLLHHLYYQPRANFQSSMVKEGRPQLSGPQEMGPRIGVLRTAMQSEIQMLW